MSAMPMITTESLLSIDDKIAHIRLLVTERISRGFRELLRESDEKVDVIVSFLALLELAREEFIRLEQSAPFEEITLTRT